MNNPIPSTENVDQQWLKEEIEEWKGIQEMINESQQHEEDKVFIAPGQTTLLTYNYITL